MGHGSMLRLDPVMSALTFFKFALQLNVKIYPMPSGVPQVPPGLEYFPAMWFNSEVTLPEENASIIVNVVRLPEFIRTLAIYSIAPVALLVLAALCVVLKVPSFCSGGGDRSNMEKVPVEETSDVTV